MTQKPKVMIERLNNVETKSTSESSWKYKNKHSQTN